MRSWIGVSFAPQEQGASSAMLEIASNDPDSPMIVTLSGTGGALPQGQTGATGATGPAGKNGKNGKVELVTCTKVKSKHRKTTKKCVTHLVTGTATFTTIVARRWLPRACRTRTRSHRVRPRARR